MTTIVMDTQLELITKYEALVASSLGSESIYIRAKDTISALAKEGDLKDADKAVILTEVISNISGSLAGTCMSTALQWVTTEKELYLKKLEIELQLALLADQIKQTKAGTSKIEADIIATQAETLRMMGKPTIVGGKVIRLADEGKHWQDIRIGVEQEANLVKERDLISSKILESTATINKIKEDNYATQATVIRNLGTPSILNDKVINLADEGKVWHEIKIAKVQEVNLVKDGLILDSKLVETDAIIEKMFHENISIQGQTIRNLGTPTVVNGKVQKLSDDGKIWQEIRISETQRGNLVKEGKLLDSKLNESFAAIHKTVADTVVNFGAWKYKLEDNGMPSVPIRTKIPGFTSLSDVQRTIAKEQAKGYSYNAWANAVTASAGMIGTVVASDGVLGDADGTSEGQKKNVLLETFKNGLDKLIKIQLPSDL